MKGGSGVSEEIAHFENSSPTLVRTLWNTSTSVAVGGHTCNNNPSIPCAMHMYTILIIY